MALGMMPILTFALSMSQKGSEKRLYAYNVFLGMCPLCHSIGHKCLNIMKKSPEGISVVGGYLGSIITGESSNGNLRGEHRDS